MKVGMQCESLINILMALISRVKHLLGVVYTMDHEVMPRPCKICDWLSNSSHDHFGLHQGKKVIVTMEFQVFIRHILKSILSTDMVQRIL
jgi:hypothetical protein